MRRIVNYALMYALSPIGTAVNAGVLVMALLIWGADPGQAFFWLAVIVFVLTSAWLDLRAYVARKRHGLSAYQATEAVTNKIWGPPRDETDQEDEEAA